MENPNPQYVSLSLPSGLAVEIRSRTYEEWEQHEEERATALDKIGAAAKGGGIGRLDAAAFRSQKELRGRILACRVRDFAKVKARLSLRDIAFIESEAEKLESAEVPLGNSASGGSGA